jgi:hypothetical protein
MATNREWADNYKAPEKKKKERNYERIVTNKNYVKFDKESCGSAYIRDFNAG